MIRNYGGAVGLASQPMGLDLGFGCNSIKSIQRGIIDVTSVSTNIAISTVDLTKSIVRIVNETQLVTKYGDTMGSLTAPTNLNLSFNAYMAHNLIKWEVIEFNNVKSLQSGTYILTVSGVEQIVPISTVNPLKSLLFFSETTDDTSANAIALGRIVSAASIGFKSMPVNKYIKWQVIEFN